MPYHKIVQELDLGVSSEALAHALRKRGYSCCKALRKPSLSEENRRVRLIWALEHINWTPDQWNRIL